MIIVGVATMMVAGCSSSASGTVSGVVHIHGGPTSPTTGEPFNTGQPAPGQEVVVEDAQGLVLPQQGIVQEGFPHLVAMWYGVIDGKIYFETKMKSQKVQNLLRDPKITCMIEAGVTYDQLRGVAIEGNAHISTLRPPRNQVTPATHSGSDQD